MRRWTRLVATACAALALTAGCARDAEEEPDDTEAVETTQAAGPSEPSAAQASHDSPAGAMEGLLAAMRAGDNDTVVEWVAPEPEGDRASITQTARMGSALGLSGGLFWEVGDRKVVSVTPNGEDAAEVALDGYIVWCNGEGPEDPKASCAQPNGSGDTQATTYPAVRIGGQWYIHLDLNHGELISGNPGAGGVAG